MKDNAMQILDKAEKFATSYLKREVPDKLVYHSYEHTRNVVKAADEIARNSGVSPDEHEIILLAAWFHDLGYSEGVLNHEEVSRMLARDFLNDHNYDPQKLQKVENCILATRMPQSPENLLEEILCDADMTHLSREDYMKRAELLRQEIENINDKEIDRLSWLRMSRVFIQDHSFFTEYARNNFTPRTRENLMSIQEEIARTTGEKDAGDIAEKDIAKMRKKLKKLKKKRVPKPNRGIETMFRLASKNHIDLSSMADTKANIMISINSIILSVLVSLLIRKLEQYPHFMLPALLLTLVCLTTIIFSILATRPQVPKGVFNEEDIEKKKTNLLFFGNFYRAELSLYEKGMRRMMDDYDYLYGSLIRDIYYLGLVLGKKYRLLRTAYTIFMFGFVISILSFIVAEVYFTSVTYPH